MNNLLALLFILIAHAGIAQTPINEALVEDYDGNVFPLSDILQDDQNYMVDVYATWCGWCKREWREWVECIDEIKSDYDLEFIIIGTGNRNGDPIPKDNVNGYFESLDIDAKVTIVYADQDSLVDNYGVTGFPTAWAMRGKVILEKKPGYKPCDGLGDFLSNHFSTSSISGDFQKNVNIFYNSINRNLQVEYSGSENITIQIFNTNGQLLKQFQPFQKSRSLSLAELNNQIVFCRIYKGTESFIKKIPVF
jgi:thiol-disulfide isomerase/thioredoxin